MDHPSPFLPGTKMQFAWDSTSLGDLKTCPRLYQYRIIEGWITKHEVIHLRFGQEYHRALEDYDRYRVGGLGHNDTVCEVLRDLLVRTHGWEPTIDHEKRSEAVKTKAALVRTVLWYLDKHQHDAIKTHIMEDGKPAVEVSFRFELAWGPQTDIKYTRHVTVELRDRAEQAVEYVDVKYLLCGHLDRVVDFNGDLMGMDRKTTTTTLSEYYYSQFEPNNQMSLYTIALQVIFQSPVKGMIIDAAQIMTDATRFGRSITYRTPSQSEEWLDCLKPLLRQAEGYAQENFWPMNDTACDKFGGCRFRKICSQDPRVREAHLRANFVQLPESERWNPLKPR